MLDGKAKAMVVVGSRVEAVRWQLAIERYIKEHGYDIGTLVAFSGDVNDLESGPEPFTETSRALNPRLKGRDIREAFKGDEYHAAVGANRPPSRWAASGRRPKSVWTYARASRTTFGL